MKRKQAKIVFIYTKINNIHVLSAVCSTFRPLTRIYCTKIKLVQYHLAFVGHGGGVKNFNWGVLLGVMALCVGETIERD